jgi:formylglycine-generating enzyme required for sulfatase activity
LIWVANLQKILYVSKFIYREICKLSKYYNKLITLGMAFLKKNLYFIISCTVGLYISCDSTTTVQPPHNESIIEMVTLPNGLFLGKYELTQKQWSTIMDTNPSSLQNSELPVEKITWYDAIEFCNRLSEKEGLRKCYIMTGDTIFWDTLASGYRLPTRMEWEYACRAGTASDFYTGDLVHSHCDTIDPALDKAGWYCANSGNMPHPGGKKKPNNFGLYDMHGNVWEWCWDWSNESNITRTLKGGSWYNNAHFARVDVIYELPPHMSFSIYGIRLARGIKKI